MAEEMSAEKELIILGKIFTALIKKEAMVVNIFKPISTHAKERIGVGSNQHYQFFDAAQLAQEIEEKIEDVFFVLEKNLKPIKLCFSFLTQTGAFFMDEARKQSIKAEILDFLSFMGVVNIGALQGNSKIEVAKGTTNYQIISSSVLTVTKPTEAELREIGIFYDKVQPKYHERHDDAG